ncbi:ABC transporter substrate-binding protein [Inconstantimicrobium mannanitabidum]|uniref:Uncharacterized protein n=1 Tax=Inconstantimicrobium mannanitabidum TaxID=1604901 RepID=A0ACB5R755_9CLOT|nr:extracellular solute-binding protein [Clostridium sp. TW13]GKX65024.1 hypothetical protein rsdtw13_02820 [Clostridium sp. TW13]
MDRLKKNLVYILVVIILSSIALYYSSRKNTSKTESIVQEKISLKVTTNRTDLVDNKLNDLAKEYMILNPNIQLSFEGIKDPNEILKIRASVGESSDITIIPTDAKTENLHLYYEPIDDLGFTKDNLRGYFTGVGEDKRLYAVNSSVGYDGIVYNKKTFLKAGIKSVPRTLDEFYKACEKLKAVGITPFAINAGDKWPLTVYAEGFVLPVENTGRMQYGDDLLTRDLFSDDGGLYYSLKFLETMKQREFIESDLNKPNWSKFKVDQANGSVSMTFTGTWYPSQLLELGCAKENIGMFPFPEAKLITQNGDWRFAISKNCKHKEEAKKLLKWLFYEGNYASACNILSSMKNNSFNNWILDELFSYNIPIVSSENGGTESGSTENLTNALIKFGYPLNDIFKEYLTSNNPDKVIKRYNDLWRKKVVNQ